MAILPREQYTKRFGRNLQRLRKTIGLTQEELAEKAGISPRYIQRIEQCAQLPDLPIIDALRRVLKVSWDELLGP